MEKLKWCLRIIFGFFLIIESVKFSNALDDVEILFLSFNKEMIEFNKKISSMAWESVWVKNVIEVF